MVGECYKSLRSLPLRFFVCCFLLQKFCDHMIAGSMGDAVFSEIEYDLVRTPDFSSRLSSVAFGSLDTMRSFDESAFYFNP